jgi:hypothetical protein
MKSTFLAQIRFPTINHRALCIEGILPELTIRSPTSHRPQQELVNLNDYPSTSATTKDAQTFLDSLRSNPVPSSGTRINSHNNATIKSECESRCSMSEFDVAVWIDVVVDMASEEGGWVTDWREREGWQGRRGRRGREER